ncbi:MAG TPA: hydantoinase/oxoprolinase family protein [Gammaproteobacteria bacterium]|jgi:N-methylhydantoinase A|nr:hydantoinase/oxoprolinase family protein [Gammaproteobacteria bacterium]
MRLGVEVGGTFTDLVAIGDAGITITKVPSVPQQPDEGAFNALVDSGIPIETIDELAHGSTVATNAVLERKGFPIAFVTTHGFRDILRLQRHGRSRIYDLEYAKPEPVVTRAACYEVVERVLADGSIELPLDRSSVENTLVPQLEAGGYEAVAICLLNAYVNPVHEEMLVELLSENLPGLHVSLSSRVSREFREYERASTTSLSAYVQPVVDRYISRFVSRLNEGGFRGRFSVMQSNGGRLPAEAMQFNAVNTLLSGPAAGVMGATRQAGLAGYTNLITFDMGGTSTDVCLVTDGKAQLTQEYSIDGLPIRVPLIDIHTIGAGGGSTIWIDDGGMLRVGPQSAGADPGPACYGWGGQVPTLTDAHVIRNTVRPEAFLGGRMEIFSDRSKAVFRPIADRLEMSLENAADSAIQLANANVVRAIQLISTERGFDPRDYVLVPFGGAGPLHAASVASDLGIKQVVVPPSAGVISAYGLIASDFTQFTSLTRRVTVDDSAPDVVRQTYASMVEEASTRFKALNLQGEPSVDFIADMRFVGQAFEVPVRFDVAMLAQLTADDIRARFNEEHHKVYFFGGASSKPVELVSFRLGMTLALKDVPILSESDATIDYDSEIEVYTDRAWHRGRLTSRASLVVGDPVAGPALLEDPTSTLFLPTGWQAVRDSHDNTIMTRI